MAALAPVDGLAAAVHRALQIHLLENLDVARLEIRRERQIRLVPLGVYAEALKALTLHVDVPLRPLAAELAKLGLGSSGHLVGSEGLFDHMLDGLTVAIPTGDVGSEVTALRVAFDDEVLEDLVERMADVNGSVGIRWAVMKNEGLSVLVLLEHAMIQILLFPFLKTLRLVLRQVAAHGEVSPGKIHGLFIAVSHEAFQPFVVVHVDGVRTSLKPAHYIQWTRHAPCLRAI